MTPNVLDLIRSEYLLCVTSIPNSINSVRFALQCYGELFLTFGAFNSFALLFLLMLDTRYRL